jgi:hypothetical protein
VIDAKIFGEHATHAFASRDSPSRIRQRCPGDHDKTCRVVGFDREKLQGCLFSADGAVTNALQTNPAR